MRIVGGFGLVAGGIYPLRALKLLWRTPRLWGYLITPILVNIVLAIALYGGFWYFSSSWVNTLILNWSNWANNTIATLPTWLGFLAFFALGIGFLIRVILILILLVIVGFIFAQFGVLLGSPWYGQLSEQLEKLRTGQIKTVEVGFVKDIWRAISFEIKKLFLAIAVGLPLLLLNLIPGIGTVIATIGGLALTATLTSLDFLDAPSERRRFQFKTKLGIVFRSLPASGSFAFVCLFLISIPLLNLITVPICVAAGTLFWCDRILPKLPER